METKLSENSSGSSGNGFHHPAISFIGKHAPRLIKLSLYLGLAYVALFVNIAPCQGQGCAYYVWHGACSGSAWCQAQHFSCYDDNDQCTNCRADPMEYFWWCVNQGCSASGSLQCGCGGPAHSISALGSIGCAIPGTGLWCLGGASLNASANDGGAHTITISGSILGSAVSCSGTNPYCSWPINTETNGGTASYGASCAGGTAGPYNLTVYLDGTPPLVVPSVFGGIPGAGSWYTGGTVNFSCTVSDSISGSGGVTYPSGTTINTDGTPTLSCVGYDVAGNTTTAYATINYDGTAPVISGAVSGTPVNGWYNAAVSLTCTATDATSGLAGITYGTMAATTSGPTTLDCTATDIAGNNSNYSTVVLVDTIAPTASFNINGDYCANDWYNSPVTIGMVVADAHSGPNTGNYQVDGVDWDSGKQVGDGIHEVTGSFSDLAGNNGSASTTVKVDTAPPFSQFTNEDESWVAGSVTLEGQSSDWTSGIALVEISLDGGRTWISVGTNSSWSYEWDTLSEQTPVPDGAYTLMVRAKDNACNQEHTGFVTINVDNTDPELSLQDSLIVLGNSTAYSAFDSGSGVGRVKVTISGNGIEPRVIEFASAGGTQGLEWDGRDGNGAVAPFGIYDVTVEVWDKVENYSKTQGTWIRPQPAESAPIAVTQIPPSIDIETAEVVNQTPDAPKSNVALALPFWMLILPIGALGVWLGASNFALSRDRRYQEIRGIRQTVERYLDQKKTNFTEEGEDD